MRLFLSLFFVLIFSVFATDKSCPSPSSVIGKTNAKKVPPCNPNNLCSFPCGKYSKNTCHGTTKHLIIDTVEYRKVCPFEGQKFHAAKAYIHKYLQTGPGADLITQEIFSQGKFWKKIIHFVTTFKNLKSASDRVNAQKDIIIPYITKQFNAYVENLKGTKKGARLLQIVRNPKLNLKFRTVVQRLSIAITTIGLARPCRCTSFVQNKYNPNGPQSEKDKVWNFALLTLQKWVDECKKLSNSPLICKQYKISSKDVSCAILPDTKGCLPVFSRLYQETISPLKNKLPTGVFHPIKQRKQNVVVPNWLTAIENEKEKKEGKITKKSPKKFQKKQVTKKAKPTEPKKSEPKKTEQKKSEPKKSEPKPAHIPQSSTRTVKITPLIIPHVPKTNTTGKKPTKKTTKKQTKKTTKKPKFVHPRLVATGPKEYIGKKKVIPIANQK